MMQLTASSYFKNKQVPPRLLFLKIKKKEVLLFIKNFNKLLDEVNRMFNKFWLLKILIFNRIRLPMSLVQKRTWPCSNKLHVYLKSSIFYIIHKLKLNLWKKQEILILEMVLLLNGGLKTSMLTMFGQWVLKGKML